MNYFFKKNRIALIIGGGLLLISIFLPWIRDSIYTVDNMAFNSYNIDVQIENDGDIFVHETIVGRFDSGMRVFFKDVPYAKNDNGQVENVSQFDTSAVAVKISNQRGLLYDSSLSIANEGARVGYSWLNDRDERNDLIRCPAGYGASCASIFTFVPLGISPITTYEFSYRIQGAVSTYADIAELNWKFYDPIDSMKMNNVNVTIHYPSSVASVDDVYFYGHGAKSGHVDAITTTHVTFSYTKLLPDDVIEMRLLLPSALIPTPRPGTFLNQAKLDYFLNLEASITRSDRLYYYLDYSVLGLAILLILFLLWFAYRAYIRYDKEHTPQFYGEYYRELPADYPPAEMGYLYNFREVGSADLSATLMDLIRRKYIEVDYAGKSTTDKNADYTLVLDKSKDRKSLKPYESFLLTWFFETMAGEKGKISLREIERYAKANATAQKYLTDNIVWSNHLKKEARKNDFFDDASEKVFQHYKGLLIGLAIISVLALFFAFSNSLNIMLIGVSALIATLLILSSYFLSIKRRSIQGNEDYVKWRAFKKFLSEFSHFDDYPLPSIVIWEHYLVYAVAFGIADLVNKQLNLRYKDTLPAEYQQSTFTRYSYMPTYMMLRLTSSSRAAQQTVQKMKSGGKGGQGGFGGGRSFGGGGGGFRGR